MPMSAVTAQEFAPCTQPPTKAATAQPPTSASAVHAGPLAAAAAVAPGVALTIGIAAAAYLAHEVPGVSAFSPLILAIVLGAALHNIVGTPAWATPGVKFSLRRVLRLGVILLGLQLTAEQVIDVGTSGLAIIAASLIGTFVFTTGLGRLMGVERKLTQLIAAGTSICGASAVIATNTVTRGEDEDVAYAIACVTIFGSIAMLSYPLLPMLLHLDAHAYGLWAGASIHEVAQVVAAAFQDGTAAGEFGTIAKLSRVMLLAPVVITLGLLAARGPNATAPTAGRPPIPWFVLGFIALIAFNSAIGIPVEAKSWTAGSTTFLLSMSLAAMGLETDISKLRAKGPRPLLLGAAASAFIALFSLLLIKLAG
jgi:uncharacterized integral membrane protein (TIGR00698 family)